MTRARATPGRVVELREVEDGDVAVFYEHQADPVGSKLAAVASRSRADHEAHWRKIRADPQVTIRTVLVDSAVGGQVLCFPRDGVVELGYWFGREYWGSGVAGEALRAFLPMLEQRPLHGVVAEHNVASRRVLERYGFRLVGREQPDPRDGEASAMLILRLD